jgi:hypothetical protein
MFLPPGLLYLVFLYFHYKVYRGSPTLIKLIWVIISVCVLILLKTMSLTDFGIQMDCRTYTVNSWCYTESSVRMFLNLFSFFSILIALLDGVMIALSPRSTESTIKSTYQSRVELSAILSILLFFVTAPILGFHELLLMLPAIHLAALSNPMAWGPGTLIVGIVASLIHTGLFIFFEAILARYYFVNKPWIGRMVNYFTTAGINNVIMYFLLR